MSIASIQAKYPSAIWFDSNYVGTNSGTVDQPYDSITDAISDITSNANVIAVKNGTHSISNIGGSAASSTLSLGGTANTLTLVGESTNAILSSSGTSFGTLVNLRNVAIALKLETIKGLSTSTSTNSLIHGGTGNVTIEGSIIEMSSATIGASTNYGTIRVSGTGHTLSISKSIFSIGNPNASFGLLIGYPDGSFSAFDCQQNTIVVKGGNSTKLSSATSFSVSSTYKNNIFVGDGNSEVLNFTPSVYTNNCFNNTGETSGGTDNLFNIDPLFVDSANNDYRLRPDSPCIGAGTAS